MSMSRPFQNVGGLTPGRSVFDLSYEKKFTCDMAQLIPVMCDEVVPGDILEIGCQSITRFQPLVAPILHEVTQSSHTFFVPYRILWDDWEEFITGGVDGDDETAIPEWDVTESPGTTPPSGNDSGSLWDFLGFPVDTYPDGALPVDFPRRAYNMIYNEFYRDQNLQTEVLLTNDVILNRNWEKDYFTSALPWQQRGTAPALPISGATSAVWESATQSSNLSYPAVNATSTTQMLRNQMWANPGDTLTKDLLEAGTVSFDRADLNTNTVDLSSATTFDISDLRLAFQIQKWMERNARGGVRYTEFLRSHFGVNPRDDRLQRPEYIGGCKHNMIISEVLQTSSTDVTSPQGNLAGHGIGANASRIGKYRVKEYGLVMTLMSVMPKPAYSQGINRQWLRKTRYDHYFPEFANLSEQAIYNAEVCVVDNDAVKNAGIFGYQARYDEMRIKQNMICSEMRDTFNYWHIAREFSQVSPPALNADFIECIPRKDIFAVDSEPGLIISYANLVKAIRPLPIIAEPGFIDHH